jgi:Ca2+-binding EF-hand superfamily protein
MNIFQGRTVSKMHTESLFKKYSHGKETIGKSELNNLMADIGVKCDEEQIDALFMLIDRDDSKLINFAEFFAWFERIAKDGLSKIVRYTKQL